MSENEFLPGSIRERIVDLKRKTNVNNKRTARHFYLSRVREKNLERSTRELFMKNYLRKQRMSGA